MRLVFPRITDAKDYIITGLLLVAALALMVSRFQGGITHLRQISVTVFSYLEEPLANIRIYREALKTNTELRRQNVVLLDELSRLRSAARQNARLRDLLEYKQQSSYPLVPVTIVGKELTGINNNLTIDAGSNHGVKLGMPLVSSEGLVGNIIMVNNQYSQVMPVFNSLFRSSAQIQGSRAYGIVTWEGQNMSELVLNYVPQTVSVDSGQVVETSGYSNQFPPHIPIGSVIRTQPAPGKETQKIYLKPFVNLSELVEGFVVKYEPDSSLIRLKEQYDKQF
ncbi:MAG: rod shape-determining protein MreC [Bacteroidota bacterium]